MSLLFPIEPMFPDGFSYYENFLSEEEEMQLVSSIARFELHTLIFQGFEAKRKVESFGHNYHFDTRMITKGKDIPYQLEPLMQKVAEFLMIEKEELQQVLVTEYPPGSVINWHRDAPPFDIIVGISLLSDCIFKLRPYNRNAREGKKSIISLEVKRRSIYIIKDESRTDWEHSIKPVESARYSITFRTLKIKSDLDYIQK
jgi:alkylated DNA repair dioxygenase AlkB